MKLNEIKKVNENFTVKKIASNNYIVRDHRNKKEIKALSYNHALTIIKTFSGNFALFNL